MIKSFSTLATEFIANSPDFESDLTVSDIDNKHKGIVGSAYNKMQKSEFWENFRNWDGQNDGIEPVNFFTHVLGNKSSLKNIALYFYTKTFLRRRNNFYKSSLIDDMEIIKMIGGEEFLKDNRISETPDGFNYLTINGVQMNLRWSRYIYLLTRILKENLLKKDEIWVDIGPFYGGLQGLVKKYIPESRMVLVDFHHQLCRSYIYLKTLYPNANHIFPSDVRQFKNLSNLPLNSFLYVPVSDFKSIKNSDVDLVSNFVSLGEMRRKHFENYMESDLFLKAKKIYLVNRFVSAPFYERTYDSDLTIVDYLRANRRILYFDIFPIHHYLLMRRKILGHMAYRNVSSPFFETITVQK
jgi:putative sugar O-methyltransferase